MSDLNILTVNDPEGDYFFMVEAKPSAGQMIFTIRKHDNETGELVSSESHFENRFMHRYAGEYETNDKPTPIETLLDEDDYAVLQEENDD